jgi:hypothetical protein
LKEENIMTKTSAVVSTIYNTSVKTKSQLREEGEKALQLFLKRGGAIETVKARKAPKSKMTGKNSRGFTGGSSGFAIGYPAKAGI